MKNKNISDAIREELKELFTNPDILKVEPRIVDIASEKGKTILQKDAYEVAQMLNAFENYLFSIL
ncbi:MAG: hypothetical protein PVJ67_06825 [Candidatus Pacearchaeota archaeon]|jgi:hypothetical protein